MVVGFQQVITMMVPEPGFGAAWPPAGYDLRDSFQGEGMLPERHGELLPVGSAARPPAGLFLFHAHQAGLGISRLT